MLEVHSQLPRIIQGGMGVAVSSWRLARRVSQLGQFGVVSGTALDTVAVRELQQGDPFGRLRVLREYPDQEIVAFLIERFYVKGGLAKSAAYRLLPIHRFKPTILSQRILAACTFSEVALAKEGHDGVVGINFLTKLKRYTLAGMLGAMLAGVDGVMMGAGIPIDEAVQMGELAQWKPARLRLDLEASAVPDGFTGSLYYELDPGSIIPEQQELHRPMFFPIVSSDVLAGILHKKLPEGAVTGWIIEGPRAGGHNAPPRNKAYDEYENPIYDARDDVNLDRVAALGYPYYLAGGYGTPERVREALDRGAQGVQIGSLFSLADESGYPAGHKAELISAIHRHEVKIRTDGRISSTGFPFKVVELEGTLAVPELLAERTRICDLGYLQTPFVDAKGRVQGRCPAEPVADYVSKGGSAADTERRACLCNGLTANIGLAQRQKWGQELRLLTAGDELTELRLGSAENPSYTTDEVVSYLLSRINRAAAVA